MGHLQLAALLLATVAVSPPPVPPAPSPTASPPPAACPVLLAASASEEIVATGDRVVRRQPGMPDVTIATLPAGARNVIYDRYGVYYVIDGGAVIRTDAAGAVTLLPPARPGTIPTVHIAVNDGVLLVYETRVPSAFVLLRDGSRAATNWNGATPIAAVPNPRGDGWYTIDGDEHVRRHPSVLSSVVDFGPAPPGAVGIAVRSDGAEFATIDRVGTIREAAAKRPLRWRDVASTAVRRGDPSFRFSASAPVLAVLPCNGETVRIGEDR